MSSAPALLRLRALEERRNPLVAFVAESSPDAPGIELVFESPLPADEDKADDRPILILRRDSRFPGLSRRGVLPVLATPDDLADGITAYDSLSFSFDFEEPHEERDADVVVTTRVQYAYEGSPRDRCWRRALRSIRRAEDNAFLSRTVRVLHHDGLAPQQVYHFTLFAGYTLDEIQAHGLLAGQPLAALLAAVANGTASPPFYLFSSKTQSAALATRKRALSFFPGLPQVHRTLDTQRPEPAQVALADAEKGQLQRLLETLEGSAHLVRGLAEGSAEFRAPRRVHHALLPAMAQYLGWTLRDDLDEDGQRNEIQFAPEFHRTVGTARNIAAMVNRLTNWDARIREFARNVAVTFDSSRLEILATGEALYLDGSLAANPSPLPPLLGRRVPVGTLDTTDPAALYRLRAHAFEDETAYTFDTRIARSFDDLGRPTTEGWFNRGTIGIYIVPDVESETFAPRDQFERIGQILAEFLPIQVRAVFVLQPGVIVEEEYDATAQVAEEDGSLGLLAQAEDYVGAEDAAVDTIPAWALFISNDLAHRSVDTAAAPLDARSRTWHVGLRH